MGQATQRPDGGWNSLDGRSSDAYSTGQALVALHEGGGVPINDLHALCMPKLAEWQLPKNVHFTPAGSRGLAEKVAKEIEAALKK